MTKFGKTALASLFTFSAAGASAAAFQLAEVSTSGLGMAFAGNAAVVDNASVVATNPALMTKFKQVEVSAGGIFVDSKIDVEGKLLTGHDASQRNIVPRAIVPNAYLVAPVNARFSLGGGVNVNYGLKSEFKPEYSAGIFGGRTGLEAVNVNLSGAYKLNDYFSLGVGVNAVHAKASLERYLGNAVELAEAKLQQGIAEVDQKLAFLSQQPNTPENQTKINALNAARVELTTKLAGIPQINALTKETDTIHKLKGDKWGFGWNVGLLYEINKNHRIGVAYHSAVKLNFKGKYSNNVHRAAEHLPVVDKATGGAEIGGGLALTLPAFWEVSGFHQFTEKFAMNYSFKRTDWSTFKSLDAYANDGSRLFHKAENFNDASRIAVGFSYDVNEKLTLRSGVAFDESASVTSPSVSIPDTDRTWYSAGFTYRFTPNLSTDFGYSHIRGSKNQFNEDGLADFTVKAKANLYGLNINYKF